MLFLRRSLALTLAATLALSAAPGCGTPPDSGEPRWREEVGSSLQSLREAGSYRYRIRLETWIGVSGQSVYGDEEGGGSRAGGDFSVQIARTSPAGGETFSLALQQGELYLQEGGAWRRIERGEGPNPLYDPDRFLRLVSAYASVTWEGEEERAGATSRLYLLRLGGDKARDTMSEAAWSYFSPLTYELSCRVWVSDAAAPPSSLQLEVLGFDPEESLQRYKLLATLEPYDVGSPDIQVSSPPAAPEQ